MSSEKILFDLIQHQTEVIDQVCQAVHDLDKTVITLTQGMIKFDHMNEKLKLLEDEIKQIKEDHLVEVARLDEARLVRDKHMNVGLSLIAALGWVVSLVGLDNIVKFFRGS